jgi:hypothetical protein
MVSGDGDYNIKRYWRNEWCLSRVKVERKREDRSCCVVFVVCRID